MRKTDSKDVLGKEFKWLIKKSQNINVIFNLQNNMLNFVINLWIHHHENTWEACEGQIYTT